MHNIADFDISLDPPDREGLGPALAYPAALENAQGTANELPPSHVELAGCETPSPAS